MSSDLNDKIYPMCDTNATLCNQDLSYTGKIKVGRGRPRKRIRGHKPVHKDRKQPETNSILCILCHTSLYNKSCHGLPDSPEKKFIAELIHPREIPPGALACVLCWLHIRKKMEETRIERSNKRKRQKDINNVCVICSASLSRRRKHRLPEGPIRDEIAAKISPRQIPDGGLVCYTCWVKSRRVVECRQREEMRQMEESQEETAEEIEEQSEQQTEPTEYLSLDKYSWVHGDFTSCIQAECKRRAARASLPVRSRLLAGHDLYLPGSARLCDAHCQPDAVFTFQKQNLSNNFTGAQIADMLFLMKHPKPVDADNIKSMDQHLRRIWLGVTWEEFHAKIQRNPSFPARAIAIRLCAMKSDECPEVIASLFQLPLEDIHEALRVTKHLDLGNDPNKDVNPEATRTTEVQANDFDQT